MPNPQVLRDLGPSDASLVEFEDTQASVFDLLLRRRLDTIKTLFVGLSFHAIVNIPFVVPCVPFVACYTSLCFTLVLASAFVFFPVVEDVLFHL